MVSVPEIRKFREEVDGICDFRDRILIEVLYLLAARVSEVSSKTCPSLLKLNFTKPYGALMTWDIKEYNEGKVKEKALLVTSAVAKRTKRSEVWNQAVKDLSEKTLEPELKKKAWMAFGQEKATFKVIALPVKPEFEPWTLDLLKWLKHHGTLSFPLTQSRILQIVKQDLHRLDPHITAHKLRHYRITHLISEYGFTPYQVVTYAGWSFRSANQGMGFGGAGQFDIYVHLQWRDYFPRLLQSV